MYRDSRVLAECGSTLHNKGLATPIDCIYHTISENSYFSDPFLQITCEKLWAKVFIFNLNGFFIVHIQGDK